MGVVYINDIVPHPIGNGFAVGYSLIPILPITQWKKSLMLTLVLGLSMIRTLATVREPYVFQCLSKSENFKSIQVLKLLLNTSFEILSEAFETLNMMLLVSSSATQIVRALVIVLGTAYIFLSFYILCKIVYSWDWLVPLFTF